jgi:hypothetical protein
MGETYWQRTRGEQNMIEQPQKPSRDYMISLLAEANGMIIEWLEISTGKKIMTQEQKDEWMKHRDYIRDEIKRVRGLL